MDGATMGASDSPSESARHRVKKHFHNEQGEASQTQGEGEITTLRVISTKVDEEFFRMISRMADGANVSVAQYIKMALENTRGYSGPKPVCPYCFVLGIEYEPFLTWSDVQTHINNKHITAVGEWLDLQLSGLKLRKGVGWLIDLEAQNHRGLPFDG